MTSMRPLPLTVSAAVMWVLAACSAETPTAQPPALVRAFTVGDPVLKQKEHLAGTPSSNRSTARQAVAEVSGQILEVLVKPAQNVVSGQPLVRIDPRDIRLADSAAKVQVQAARAELASAEADFLRYTELKKQQFISPAEWERRRAALEVTRARFEATLDQLGVSSIRALETATVTTVLKKPGDRVSAGDILVRLAPDDPRAGAEIQRSVANKLPGIVIPITAVIDGQAVMKIVPTNSGYTVQRQAVRLGIVRDREAQVAEGLAAGDQIVAIGAHLLTTGQTVRLLQDKEP
jgi:multidrug efflux pump subunit AcrA (membrane-fusion protein)